MATVYIKDLSLRTLIGIQDWEKEKQQDIVLNVSFDYDASRAAETDDITHAVDYKALKQKIVALVEARHFNLVEKLAQEILDLTMEDARIQKAVVMIDKPQALRFAKSVSVSVSAQRRP